MTDIHFGRAPQVSVTPYEALTTPHLTSYKEVQHG